MEGGGGMHWVHGPRRENFGLSAPSGSRAIYVWKGLDACTEYMGTEYMGSEYMGTEYMGGAHHRDPEPPAERERADGRRMAHG